MIHDNMIYQKLQDWQKDLGRVFEFLVVVHWPIGWCETGHECAGRIGSGISGSLRCICLGFPDFEERCRERWVFCFLLGWRSCIDQHYIHEDQHFADNDDDGNYCLYDQHYADKEDGGNYW